MSNRAEVSDYRWGIGRFGRAVDREIEERQRDMAHVQMLREAAMHEDVPAIEVSEESPSFNFTETGGADHMSLQEKVLYYAMFILHFGLSDEEIKRMEELMEVLYGTAPPISVYEQHVRQLYRNLLNDYNRKRYFFCTACGYPLREWRNLCENVGCALYRVCIKRAKSVQRTEIHVLNIVPQLIDSITNQIEQIINFHRNLHEAEADRGEDRSDTRLFTGYREAIESANEFFACRLRILLSLSVDGFIPRRLSRREVWPLYLRIENIARAEGDNFYNTLLAGALYTPAKPSDAMMETLFSRLESELSDLQANPIAVDMDGSTWTVEVHLYRGIADMAAHKILYGVPAWNRDYGCSKCNMKGIVQGRQRMWLAEREEVTSLRTPESYAEDARNYGQFGILRSCFRVLSLRMRYTSALKCDQGPNKRHVRIVV
ncbi:unnamed protein product [Cylicostephanus goldi]|uniref:Uncharacterized protein n=1 Tax=Cylicostephanus goldi TaxID=71465 RepID=A0A3P6QXE3_CYLGO|nr:unnamed protein product [Cylicostephanus goldi]